MLGSVYKSDLLKLITEEDLLDFLGGTSSWHNNNNTFIEVGRWHNKGYWDPLNDSYPIVSCNGNLIMNNNNTKLVYESYDELK